jgi:hypothetical protein
MPRGNSFREPHDTLLHRTVFFRPATDFAALAKPTPLSVQETQALLGDDEALVILDFDQRSYGVLITRTSADGGELNITAKSVEDQVKALRKGQASSLVVVLILQATLFQTISHLTKYKDCEHGHPLPLVRTESLIERLPRVSELF